MAKIIPREPHPAVKNQLLPEQWLSLVSVPLQAKMGNVAIHVAIFPASSWRLCPAVSSATPSPPLPGHQLTIGCLHELTSTLFSPRWRPRSTPFLQMWLCGDGFTSLFLPNVSVRQQNYYDQILYLFFSYVKIVISLVMKITAGTPDLRQPIMNHPTSQTSKVFCLVFSFLPFASEAHSTYHKINSTCIYAHT